MVKYNSLTTPYYRTIPEFSGNLYPNEPESNYDSYDLFCLRTKLLPVVQDMFPDIPGIYITFVSNNIQNRMVKVVQIKNGNDVVQIKDLPDAKVSKLQETINKEISNRPKICLIIKLSDIKTLPSDWSVSVSSALSIPNEIDPLLETLDNDVFIYGKLDELSKVEDYQIDFTSYRDTLQDDISFQLHEMYKSGYIVGADSIAKKWDLINISPGIDGTMSIYRPSWKDNRFAPDMIEFLRNRIAEPNGYIKINIGSNKVTRHVVASKLSELGTDVKVLFNGEFIMIKVGDLDQARKIVKYVTIAQMEVRKFSASSLSLNAASSQVAEYYHDNITNYLLEHPELFSRDVPREVITYFTSNMSFPYTISALVPLSTDIEGIKKRLEIVSDQ